MQIEWWNYDVTMMFVGENPEASYHFSTSGSIVPESMGFFEWDFG